MDAPKQKTIVTQQSQSVERGERRPTTRAPIELHIDIRMRRRFMFEWIIEERGAQSSRMLWVECGA
jgi:hypothetical protein